MTETKAKAPFISGPYYKEIFREMKTIGIIFCILQTVIGLLENLLSPVVAVFIMLTGTGKYQNVMLLYFFVAVLNFLNAYIKRSAWDFRGSLPLKKRTIYASHLAAALTWAAFIFVANYVGMLMGELLQLTPGVVTAGVLPAGFIGSGAALLQQAQERRFVGFGQQRDGADFISCGFCRAGKFDGETSRARQESDFFHL